MARAASRSSPAPERSTDRLGAAPRARFALEAAFQRLVAHASSSFSKRCSSLVRLTVAEKPADRSWRIAGSTLPEIQVARPDGWGRRDQQMTVEGGCTGKIQSAVRLDLRAAGAAQPQRGRRSSRCPRAGRRAGYRERRCRPRGSPEASVSPARVLSESGSGQPSQGAASSAAAAKRSHCGPSLPPGYHQQQAGSHRPAALCGQQEFGLCPSVELRLPRDHIGICGIAELKPIGGDDNALIGQFEGTARRGPDGAVAVSAAGGAASFQAERNCPL